jgi:hypothetical protein
LGDLRTALLFAFFLLGPFFPSAFTLRALLTGVGSNCFGVLLFRPLELLTVLEAGDGCPTNPEAWGRGGLSAIGCEDEEEE